MKEREQKTRFSKKGDMLLMLLNIWSLLMKKKYRSNLKGTLLPTERRGIAVLAINRSKKKKFKKKLEKLNRKKNKQGIIKWQMEEYPNTTATLFQNKVFWFDFKEIQKLNILCS